MCLTVEIVSLFTLIYTQYNTLSQICATAAFIVATIVVLYSIVHVEEEE